MKINDIKIKIIPDSGGKDTIEAVLTAGVLQASAAVPSGKSTGATEAAVVPPAQALDKVSWLISQLKDQEFASLDQFDNFLITLDGTENKSNLGGNLILSLSMAFVRLLAKESGLELFELLAKVSGTKQVKIPFGLYNLIEGGVHAENSLPFQEYLLIPQTASAKESLEIVNKAIKLLGEKIQKEFGQQKSGDEGGYAVPSKNPEAGLRALQELISQNNLNSKIGLDVAASAFYQDGIYLVGGKKMSTDELFAYYQQLIASYETFSIEDPFNEEDWSGFAKITAFVKEKVWIIGDDLLTTNVERIKKAHQLQAANAVLIKPNQIGTISETIQAVNLAKSYGWKTVVSHRSGETMDDFIADLAVGVGADGLKSGCPLQKERLVKYQRLLQIEKKFKID